MRLPERRGEPETVIAHLGPTNSGKTHDALRFLIEAGRGAITGLRPGTVVDRKSVV